MQLSYRNHELGGMLRHVCTPYIKTILHLHDLDNFWADCGLEGLVDMFRYTANDSCAGRTMYLKKKERVMPNLQTRDDSCYC